MSVNYLGMALLYGDRFDLHERMIQGLRRAGINKLPMRLWMNAACPRTRALLQTMPTAWRVTDSEENVPKYVVMGRMLAEARKRDDWNWLFWYDDDCQVVADDYLENWTRFIADNDPVYIGQKRDRSLVKIPGMLGFGKELWGHLKEFRKLASIGTMVNETSREIAIEKEMA